MTPTVPPVERHLRRALILFQLFVSLWILGNAFHHIDGPIDRDEGHFLEICAEKSWWNKINPFAQRLAQPIVDAHGIVANVLACASLSAFGAKVWALRFPAVVITSLLLAFVFFCSQYFSIGFTVLLYCSLASNALFRWYSFSERGYVLLLLLALTEFYLISRLLSQKSKILNALLFMNSVVLCFAHSFGALFFLLNFALYLGWFWLRDNSIESQMKAAWQKIFWNMAAAVPAALLMIIHTYLQHRGGSSQPHGMNFFFGTLSGLLGLPRRKWGIAVALLFFLGAWKALQLLFKKETAAVYLLPAFSLVIIDFVFSNILGTPLPTRVLLPFYVPLLALLFCAVSFFKSRALQVAILIGEILLVGIFPFLYSNEIFDQSTQELFTTSWEIFDKVRETHRKHPDVCFHFDGDEHERGWLKHFAKKEHIKTCTLKADFNVWTSTPWTNELPLPQKGKIIFRNEAGFIADGKSGYTASK